METLNVEARDGFAIVRLDRPPVNAVSREMMRELRQCFDALSEDRRVNAVVLSATGDRAFCAGIDLKETAASAPDPSTMEVRSLLDPRWEWRAAQHAVRHCLVPVIAAVDGAAIGAGFGLVGIADLIVASRRASFGLTEINVGVLGGASKALRLLGPSKARRMLFFGEMLPAEAFYRLGAVEEVVEPGRAEERACELAAQLATKSPLGLRLAKESVLRIEGDGVEEQYRTEQDYSGRLRTYADSREAMEAFLERRPPVWNWS
jgi:enoyl-CoA hydratase